RCAPRAGGRRRVSSVAHVSRLPSRSIWIPPREVPTFTLRAAIPERTPIPTPSPLARSPALCTALPARPERRDDPGRAHLLDPAAECPDLLDEGLHPPARAERGIDVGRQDQRAPQERELPAFPPDGQGRAGPDRGGPGRGLSRRRRRGWRLLDGRGPVGPGCSLPRRSLRSLPR